jgi:membrane protein DedA with SNARE-associated domain
MPNLIEQLPQLILSAVEANPLLGYGAIALVMLLENVIPPIPSEVVMPLAGFLIQQGKLQLVPVLLAGLVGTVLGAWFWYGVGRLINEQRLEHWMAKHGRWFGLRAQDPGVRTFVSLPAGIELMPQPLFLAWTTAGSLLWLLFLTLAGKALGSGYAQIEGIVKPFARILLAIIALGLLIAGLWLGIKAVMHHWRRSQGL